MCHAELYANEGLLCQKQLWVDRQVCHQQLLKLERPHFKCDGAVYSFAGVTLRGYVSPFTQRSQISLAEPASTSVEPKHLDEKWKIQPFSKSASQTFFTVYLFSAYCLRRVFHLHAVKHPDERRIPFHNSSWTLGTQHTQYFL